jgi:hypothetical protein
VSVYFPPAYEHARHVGFVVDKVELEPVFSEYISVSPANLHSANFSIITITYHPGLVQQASCGRSTQSPTPIIFLMLKTECGQSVMMTQRSASLTGADAPSFP